MKGHHGSSERAGESEGLHAERERERVKLHLQLQWLKSAMRRHPSESTDKLKVWFLDPH